ncbi:redoxin domain-containing protein [Aureibacter tunicatorum]|uniref:Peroxiredoxin n=1 Tax=Aureibacter tunicatorum TaxID=866807 RepID=A0AAE3XM24_9BACT|nr:redoxin domain-containing protein [Aureibacter tunicatorum]MDR6238454.1 peroxiredoxin [Aureibacter tunicatorum]BDD05612.1 hypothetical protein AUTU_30950 [Aureibacter tunicatorum]
MKTTFATILANDNKTSVEASKLSDGKLWIKESELKASTGYELKSSGICYPELDICIPAHQQGWTQSIDNEKWINVSAISQYLGQACVNNKDKSIWSLGILPERRSKMLESNLAPDFSMLDIHGETVTLSKLKGKKVLIVTWATWCGCRFDLKSWQKIYEELNDPNFEIICVAQDSQGEEVARKWFVDAKATFKCIVDPSHKISSLFGWVNVPTGAWIDENGKIVRVNEAAYAQEHEIKNLVSTTKFGSNAFGDATKKWVKFGLTDDIKQSQEKLSLNTRMQNAEDFKALAHFKLGLHLLQIGHKQEAEQHFDAARKLAPDNWNIQRQSWTFKGTLHAIKSWNRITRANAESDQKWTYYQPMDLANASTRRTTRIEFIWEKWADKCKNLFKS